MDLKEQGFTIVGYCRKSTQKRKSKNLVNLLQTMVVNLYERSLADFMFVSPMDNANTPFSLRDIDCDMSVIRQLKNIQKVY